MSSGAARCPTVSTAAGLRFLTAGLRLPKARAGSCNFMRNTGCTAGFVRVRFSEKDRSRSHWGNFFTIGTCSGALRCRGAAFSAMLHFRSPLQLLPAAHHLKTPRKLRLDLYLALKILPSGRSAGQGADRGLHGQLDSLQTMDGRLPTPPEARVT